MTVKELKEELSKYDDNLDVYIYEEHFENLEPADSCSQTTYRDSYTDKVIIDYWSK